MRRIGSFFFVVMLTIGCWLPARARAAEDISKFPVEVNGDQVNYFDAEKKVVGSGHVVVTYKDVRMTCEKVTAYLDAKEAIAEGNVVVTRGMSVIKGNRVSYNFEKETADIAEGTVTADPFFGSGHDIKKLGPDEYSIGSGYLTTCDRPKPHYKLRARNVRIYLGKRIVAKNVFLTVGDVPVMYVPVYSQPLNDKFAKINVVPGHDKKWGTYLLSSYRYYFNDNAKGTIHLDYRQLKGFGEGVDYNFKSKDIGMGYLRTYYINEHDKVNDTERERWRIQYRHKWEISPTTVATLEYHQLTDKDLIKDYFYREEYERDPRPTSYASVVNTQENFATSLLITKRVNDFFTEVERLPELELNIKNQRLVEELPFFYKGDFTASSLDKKFADSDEGHNTIRADSYNQLALPFRVADFLSVDPYAGTRQTFYSREGTDDRERFRGALYAGVDLSTNFYRLYNYKTDALGLDVDGLRHIVTPTLSYYYIQKPTLLRDRVYAFDDIDTIDKKNGIGIGVGNILQTKRRNEKNELYTAELMRWIVSTDYVDRSNTISHRLSTIGSDIELSPYRWLFLKQTALYDPASTDLLALNTDISAHDPRDTWRYGVGHRYEQRTSSQVTAEAEARITPLWKCRIYERYECKGRQAKEQEYAITRDLHCWEVEVAYNIRDVHTVWVLFRLKAFPGMPLKLGTSYYRPRTGAPSAY